MRLLFALPYGPSVTRVRARMILSEMAARHDVTVAALAWDEQDVQSLSDLQQTVRQVVVIPHVARPSLHATGESLRYPLQYVVSRSQAFAGAVRQLIEEARASGTPFDAIHIEHLRGAAAADMLRPLGVQTLFDSVDCLAELARLTRTHGPNPLVRGIAGYEQLRTRRLETQLLKAADVVTVVAERDRIALQGNLTQGNVVVVPNGVDAKPAPRGLLVDPVAVFTGKLSYHANQTAARWLLDEIWPQVRRIVPDAGLIVAGADPPAWLRKRDGAHGVHIIPNPKHMQHVLMSARVALAPVVYSVGVQNKVLEAMACGLPVVATASAAGGLIPQSHGRFALANDARHFAVETARLLTDDRAADRLGLAGYEYVKRHHTWSGVADLLEALYRSDAVIERAA